MKEFIRHHRLYVISGIMIGLCFVFLDKRRVIALSIACIAAYMYKDTIQPNEMNRIIRVALIVYVYEVTFVAVVYQSGFVVTICIVVLWSCILAVLCIEYRSATKSIQHTPSPPTSPSPLPSSLSVSPSPHPIPTLNIPVNIHHNKPNRIPL
jgi:hypothetical protein